MSSSTGPDFTGLREVRCPLMPPTIDVSLKFGCAEIARAALLGAATLAQILGKHPVVTSRISCLSRPILVYEVALP
jgi:hypothetical protein